MRHAYLPSTRILWSPVGHLAGTQRHASSDVPLPDPNPLPDNAPEPGSSKDGKRGKKDDKEESPAASGLRDTVITTACGVALLALGGKCACASTLLSWLSVLALGFGSLSD